MILSFLIKLVSLLHSGKEPRHLAAGFALGSILGLTPLLSLQNLLIACLVLLLDVSIASALFGMAIFAAFAYLLDPVFSRLGYFLLVEVGFLRPLWTCLYNVPIAPLTRFYNTVVMGSLVSALLLFSPVYLGFKHTVRFYRDHLQAWVERLWIMRMIKANSIYQWYHRIRSLGV